MIGWNHLVEIKRIEKLALIIFPPTHHARLPLMPIHQRNHGSRVVSTGVLQHYPLESGHRSIRSACLKGARNSHCQPGNSGLGDLVEFLSAFYDVAGSAKLTQNLD